MDHVEPRDVRNSVKNTLDNFRHLRIGESLVFNLPLSNQFLETPALDVFDGQNYVVLELSYLRI
jgi:hypothetical protein